VHATLPLLVETDFPALRRQKLDILQVNLGYLCNQQCLHCHVNAGPKRTEVMSLATIDQVLDYLSQSTANTLDLTGGAPELNPHFRYVVDQAVEQGVKVIDRCNLTILSEPGQDDLADYLADRGVEVVASLPCYALENVDAQRGKGVFDRSIAGLQQLNKLGYGISGSKLKLNLVYNPQGPTLPPAQAALEQDYKQQLKDTFGIAFNQLYTITNMPIQRFGSMLISKGQFQGYMGLLRDSYSAQNLATVMCRSTLSVDWQGYIYDCDFNQMLNLSLQYNGKPKVHVSELQRVDDLTGNTIAIADHCYGCTAGSGSSCGGALS